MRRFDPSRPSQLNLLSYPALFSGPFRTSFSCSFRTLVAFSFEASFAILWAWRLRVADRARGRLRFSPIAAAIMGQGSAPASPVASVPMGGLSAMPAGPVVQDDGNAAPGTVGMNQRLADLAYDFIDDNPGTSISSGFRSAADQARLYADRDSNPNPVAPPGTSNHERGNAVDIAGMSPATRAMLPQYGLAQPVANDPPHVEPARPTKSLITAAGSQAYQDATAAQKGIVRVDGTTITASGGVITAVGAAASSVAIGTTTISSGTAGRILYDNAGVLGELATIPTANGGVPQTNSTYTPTITCDGGAHSGTFSGGGLCRSRQDGDGERQRNCYRYRVVHRLPDDQSAGRQFIRLSGARWPEHQHRPGDAGHAAARFRHLYDLVIQQFGHRFQRAHPRLQRRLFDPLISQAMRTPSPLPT